MPKVQRFHGLKRVKVRQSWNKANLYNLARLRPAYLLRTFYQQKWTAKAISKAYHAEHVKERKWQRQFSPTLRSVVSMDHRYLAALDGSEQAEGRGSGKDVDPQLLEDETKRPRTVNPTPYMQMTFAPLERRLDTAIFRALFASSARQARQFVVHGGVKVNGKKMIHPGYLLNPGDMFQVEPDRVMFATGAPKQDDRENIREGVLARRRQRFASKAKARKAQQPTTEPTEAAQDAEATSIEPAAASTTDATPSTPVETEAKAKSAREPETEEEQRVKQKALFQNLLGKIREAQAQRDAPTANRKKELRNIYREIRGSMGKMRNRSVPKIEEELAQYMSQLTIASRPKGQPTPLAEEVKESEASKANAAEETEVNTDPDAVSQEEADAVKEMLREAKENPYDPTKPYATPWTPRPYMSPFAFIPRYLEVNQNICSAVYLRHPVARPGMAEVPTPFGYETAQLAYLWYLRRR